MPKRIRSLASSLLLGISLALSPARAEAETIYRDVAIIGGGASGSYSAVRLREDYNLSVVLIEKSPMLGGHVNTWVDPATGRGYDAGVQNFIDIGPAKAFFARLGVPTAPNARSGAAQVYVDFATGSRLKDYTAPAAADRTAALQRYLAETERYLEIMEPGWWAFPPPENVPGDLLLPFRDFVAKHNLTAAVPQIFATTGFGMADLMGGLTLWVMRSFSYNMCRTILGLDAAFVPASRRNQDLYDAVLKRLGPDVLLSSTVLSARRSDSHQNISVQVRDAAGAVRRVVARRLLYTPVPSPENLAPFDLDDDERAVFGRFSFSASYVGVVSHPALPPNTSLQNTAAAAQPDRWASAVPAAPFNTRFDNYAGTPYYRVIAVGDRALDLVGARSVVADSFDRMVAAGTVSRRKEELTFHYFEPHGLVSAFASRADLDAGFVAKLNSLQGRRSTWYTGASWGVHLTTNLWIFTDTVLEKLAASLRG